MSRFFIKAGIFTIAGAALGYAYYYFIGCRTGSCPLTSNPLITTLYGSLLGLVLGFDKKLLNRNASEEQ